MRTILILLFLTVSVSAQTINFTDNFDDGNFNGWTKHDDSPPRSGPSNWFVENEVLRQTSNIWAYDAPDEFKYHLGTHLYSGENSWYNYSFNVLIRSTDNDGIGILFRYQDSKNYYRFIIMDDPNNGGPFRRLQKFVNGEPETIHETKPTESIPKGWFSLTADVREDTIKIYINGELHTNVVEQTYKKGKIGLTCYANSGSYFDSVKVSDEKIIYSAPENPTVYVNRYPYIQLPDTNSVLIAWRTTQKFTGKIEYGLTGKYGLEVVEDSSSYKHSLKISGLSPDTKYYYRVLNGSDQFGDSAYFYTKPGNQNDTVSILAFGDSGVNNQTQYNVASLMENEVDNIDFGIHVGDVSQGSGDEYDEIFFKPYQNIVNKKNIFVCIGNHDTYYDNAATYLDSYYLPHNNKQSSERYYSYRWGSTFFINMDSNIDFNPGSDQYEFLTDALKSEDYKTADWTFVYFHHPPYCELWDSWDGDDNVRNHLVPLFEKYNVDMVLNGHTHGYERGELNRVHYIITGGGGGGLDTYARDFNHIDVSLEKHHYSIININGRILNFKAVDINGNIIDTFSIDKSTTGSIKTGAVINNYKLEQNFPNPFNPDTKISFNIPENSQTNLTVYNLLGENVAELVNGFLIAGHYEEYFSGKELASGIYYYRLNAGKYSETRKMVLLK